MEITNALLLIFGVTDTLLLSLILGIVYDIHFQIKYHIKDAQNENLANHK